MERLLGPEFRSFLESYSGRPIVGLRVNTLKGGISELSNLLPWPIDPVRWCQEGFQIAPHIRAGRHPFHAAGLFYLQEPSAMAAVEALDVQPGQLVLDVAAAPGGKSTHIASHLQDRGVLVANDPIPGRIKALGENLERWGVRNAIMTNSPVADLSDAWPGIFDRVLVDAPCSGEGMFRKSLFARQEWSEEHVRGCEVRQALLLTDAARMVKGGGLLLYSTCTFAPEENEHQICRFLELHPEWDLVEIPKSEGLSPGRSDWTGDGCPADIGCMARIWPHLAPGEGHAMALLRAPVFQVSDSDVQDRRRFTGNDDSRSDEEAAVLWDRFKAENLPEFKGDGVLTQHGDQLYLAPQVAPVLNGVRVVRSGLPLGRVRPGRFEPSHALALAMPRGSVMQHIELESVDVARYLHGEMVNSAGPAGWVLITIQGFGLGWGKRSGDVVKNHYPKGLRW